jgi:curved DNA-binding protein CbpA
MKDYYKILGVKETASMDEIRDQWVELMREFHPDQGKEGATEEEERVKEINEAYQVLKHSATRVEYDLKRAYEPKEKNIFFRKWGVPLSIVIVLMVIGAVYFSRPRDPSISKPIDHSTEDSVLSPGSGATQMTPSDEEVVPDQTDQANKAAPGHAPQSNPPGVIKAGQDRGGQPPLNAAGTEAAPKQIVKVIVPVAPLQASDKSTPMIATDQPPKNSGRSDTVEKTPTLPPPLALGASVTPEAQTNQPKPGPFIAEETEINRFLVDYRERYVQRDTTHFLQMFSTNAVQNQKQKMDDIRRIYEAFFNQSKDLQYLIEDVSIEIYQNAVEVNARYKVDQTLKKGGEKKLWKGSIRWVLVKEDEVLKILLLDYQLIK